MGKKNALMLKLLHFFVLIFVFSGYSSVTAAERSIQELFTLGQEAFEAKRYQESINYFEGIIEQNNNFAAAYHALGLVYQEVSSDPYYPLWYFETALEVDPNFAPSYDVLCRAYHQMQKYAEAEGICLKALELNPNLIGSQLSLAWVYLIGYSDANRAVYYFEKVIDKIKIPYVYFGLGMAYAMRGEHGKVLDIVTHLRSEGAENLAIHLEAVIRNKTSPEKFIPPGFMKSPSSQTRTSGAADPSGAASQRKVVPIPVPVVVKPKITGSPKVRITGKIRPPQITGITGYSKPPTLGGQKERHPGSLSED